MMSESAEAMALNPLVARLINFEQDKILGSVTVVIVRAWAYFCQMNGAPKINFLFKRVFFVKESDATGFYRVEVAEGDCRRCNKNVALECLAS
ncbi:hypothetical protein [Halioxenophilus aromaticivorans]|uniref:Uncharacterized protein n=1 Tax=Halioxenophilus aromaticivorans TaxID=1306992 RepID=A0AAV3TZ16_9ALTE